MSTTQSKAVVRTFVDAVNDRDYDRFDAVFAPTRRSPPSTTRLPGLAPRAVDIVAEGVKVVARLPWTGTQRGPLLDLAAPGRRVEVDEMILFRLVDVVVVEAGEVWDEATMPAARRAGPGRGLAASR